MATEYIRTDEVSDFLCSTAWVERSLEKPTSDSCCWKWAIISLHSALQGALVCHLSGTANLGALESGRRYETWLLWLHEREGNAPILPRLANVPTLLKRMQGIEGRLETAGSEISLNSDEKKAVDLLCELRNEFSHFPPQSWSIETAGLRPMLVNVISVISHIAEDGWPFRHASNQQKRQMKQLLETFGNVT